MSTLSLAAVLAESARRYPDKVALVDREDRITYRDLWRQALAYAGHLRALGVRPGDTVALLAPNVAEFPRAYFGILAAGATVVPVHLLLTPAEMAYVLRDSGAGLLLADPSQLDTATKAAGDIPMVALGADLTAAGG
ncbi:MAG TPA: AMP-binding protein, partial [Micromonosporaceae bacterium]